MASPNYDSLSVTHSKNIGDAVASASSNGIVWSSAQRDTHLNNAIRRWMKLQIEAGNFNALKGYIAIEEQALSNNTKALSGWTGGVAWILSAMNSTDGVIVRRLPDGYESVAKSGSNSYYTPSSTEQFWKQEGSTFRLLDGSTTTNDTIRLEYVKQHSALSAGGASDILIGAEYWDEILKLAYVNAMEEKATKMEIAKINEATVERQVVQTNRIANK